MKFALSSIFVPAALADPDQPHLAQAWQALSTGDGLPGQIGLESYVFLEQDQGDFQAHKWDYGRECTKIEMNAHGHKEIEPEFRSGTYYLGCYALNCCFHGKGTAITQIPAVKQWDIATPSLISKTEFLGYMDTKELYDNPVIGAETWTERDFVKFLGVNYTYRFHREESGDVISHRIDYEAPGAAPGSITYGNFTVQHDIDSFRQVFALPEACWHGTVRGCDDDDVDQWDEKYFKHSAMLKKLAKQQMVV
jgi:hypothetical protein